MIGIVAPSSVVPRAELELGVQKLRDAGFKVRVHPQCKKKHLFFAGTDLERAQAFFDYAIDSEIDTLWCARGGYGANHLLKFLEKFTAKRGIPPKKLLIGASDSTCLMEFARSRWGWEILHAPMPGLRGFQLLSSTEWSGLRNWVRGEQPKQPWGARKLRFFGKAPAKAIDAVMVGGNLTVWSTLCGTPFEPSVAGKILFIEDVTESLPRMDRMVQQLVDCGGFEGVRAIVLGNFLNCSDAVPSVLAKVPVGRTAERVIRAPKPAELQPLRRRLSQMQGLKAIFGEVGERLEIPVAYGLPVGHGPEHRALPLGGRFRLASDGQLECIQWGWLGKKD